MSNPRLRIDLARITHNARKTVDMARSHGVEVTGVTKGVAGNAEVARAMLAGGIQTLADSRLDNIARLRSAGIEAPVMLLRSPGPSDVSRTVALADVSLNAGMAIMEALSSEASARHKVHGVILMVDLHTGREGLPVDQVPAACGRLRELPGVQLQGIGAYYRRWSACELLLEGLKAFVDVAKQVESQLGPLPLRSGGSSNIFRTLMIEGHSNPGINHVRVGTILLLGFRSSIDPVTLPGYERDTFVLHAEVIETKATGSGEAILALGKLDTDPEFLFPLEPGVQICDASSDHLVVRTSAPTRVGDWVGFRLGYPALSRLMVSPYLDLEYVKD